ncbi:unnamed protein product, partial [Porites lobata]
ASSPFTAIQAAICSGLGGFGLLPSAARQETEFGCRWQLVILNPATSCSTSNRPACRSTFTGNGSAGVAGNRRSDQAVAAIALKFKLIGPASTNSPLHSSTCRVTPCGTVHFLESSGPNIQQAQGHAAIQDTVEVPAVHDGVQ